jgi:hypothetical protein
MDETEVTNSKYRQFVYYVRDSILRERLAEIDETYRNNGITFDNVIFGTKDAIAREFVVGGNGTTGIGKIEAAGQYVKDSIYNLGGRVVNGIKKGINIITNNDGKTRKVVKK